MGVKDKAFTWSEATNRAVYGLNSFHAKGYPVKSSDLDSLNGAIERWSKFLRSVFLGSSVGYVAPEKLHQMSLEDTEFYLDVKIQLSQCMAGVQDDILANRLEMICKDSRKNSYRFLSNTMPMLNENPKVETLPSPITVEKPFETFMPMPLSADMSWTAKTVMLGTDAFEPIYKQR